MRKLISFMHISLDGFVAGPNGELNWAKVDEELFNHVGKRIQETDTALYGRKTFQLMEGYWPTAGDKPDASAHDISHAAWYKNARKLVLSDTLQENEFSNTRIINGNIAEQIHAMKQDPGSEILVFGSPTATHTLLDLGLIDGFWLFLNPVVLGNGIPLFTGNTGQIQLQLIPEGRAFNSGVTELKYELKS